MLALICLAIGLWPVQATGRSVDSAKGRYIARIESQAAVPAAIERLREQVHADLSVAGVAVDASGASGAARPLSSAAQLVHSPSYRVATHLSL
jgi:hypothetical protein